jgi:hypothetical protein
LLDAREAAFDDQIALIRKPAYGKFTDAALLKMMRLTRWIGSIDAARYDRNFPELAPNEITWLEGQGVPTD